VGRGRFVGEAERLIERGAFSQVYSGGRLTGARGRAIVAVHAERESFLPRGFF